MRLIPGLVLALSLNIFSSPVFAQSADGVCLPVGDHCAEIPRELPAPGPVSLVGQQPGSQERPSSDGAHDLVRIVQNECSRYNAIVTVYRKFRESLDSVQSWNSQRNANHRETATCGYIGAMKASMDVLVAMIPTDNPSRNLFRVTQINDLNMLARKTVRLFQLCNGEGPASVSDTNVVLVGLGEDLSYFGRRSNFSAYGLTQRLGQFIYDIRPEISCPLGEHP